MAHDGSFASQIEDWIIQRINTVTYNAVAVFATENVRPWEGSEAPNKEQVADELMGGSDNAIAKVFFMGDRPQPLESGEIEIFARFIVYVGMRFPDTNGTGRRGDATRVGINRLKDLIRYATHNINPDKDDGVNHSDKCEYQGCEVVIARKDVWVLRIELEVKQVPMAA